MKYESKEIESPVYDEKGNLLYGVVRNMVSKATAEAMSESLIDKFKKGKMHHDRQCPESLSTLNPFCRIQQQLTWFMCDFFKKNLCPTYNYARHYVDADVLHKHRDRPSCQYSMTLSLSREEGEDIWPFYAQYKEQPQSEILMDVGDCTIYRGCDVEHWRDANDYGTQYQTFLHYVDIDGEYKDFVYDAKNKPDYSRFFSSINPNLHLNSKPKKK